MCALLSWRDARREDRLLLKAFECTYPRPRHRQTHPREWELEVQSVIRQLPVPWEDRSVLLGMDTDGLGAVSVWGERGGLDDIRLYIIAVARRFRGKGGVCARETLEECLVQIEGRARDAGHSSLSVSAVIDGRNEPSQKLVADQGFQPDPGYMSLTYQLWTTFRELAPAEGLPDDSFLDDMPDG